MAAAHKKVISFSEYKEMSDEIKSYFKPEFARIHDRFKTLDDKIDALDKKFDEKFKFVIGICSAILIAVIASIITTAFK
jgi:predicted nuclease with TOPRIM domain